MKSRKSQGIVSEKLMSGKIIVAILWPYQDIHCLSKKTSHLWFAITLTYVNAF